MKLPFCVACNSRRDLHHHHFILRSEGGDDDETNLITLCHVCHARLHGRSFKDLYDWKALQRAGIDAAKARGVYKGRQPVIDREKVVSLRREGMGATAIAKAVGCRRGNVYKTLQAAGLS